VPVARNALRHPRSTAANRKPAPTCRARSHRPPRDNITIDTGPLDSDGSGAIDFDDLFAVLAAWGPCASCPEDLDGNGSVGLDELLLILSNWGACPE
jgi:hypothetical protein